MHAQLVRVEQRIARTESQRLDDGAQIGLGGETRKRVDGAVDRIGARLDGGEHARGRNAAGVMRVEMNGQPDFLLERCDQRGGRARLAQSRHILDGDHVRAHGALSSLAMRT